MKKALNICNLYTGMFCLYYLQGALYTEGSLISKGLLVCLLAISFYYMYIAIIKNKSPFFLKSLGGLVVLFSIYGIIRIMGGNAAIAAIRNDVSSYNYLKGVYLALLPVFPYYCFTKQGLITERWISNWFFVFLLVATASFFYAERTSQQNTGFDNITNNSAYYFVALFPLLYFLRNKPFIHYICLLFVLLMIAYGMKRGAILIGLIMMFFYANHSVRRVHGIRRIFILLLIFCVLVGVYYYVLYLFNYNDYFYYRYEQTVLGDTSGRDRLYSLFWTAFVNQSNSWVFLFGGGLDATVLLSGTGAHNDWLEIAIDMGVLGLSFYLIYWISLIFVWRRTNSDETIHFLLGLVLLSSLFRSFYSCYVNDTIFYVSCLVGYCLAHYSYMIKQ